MASTVYYGKSNTAGDQQVKQVIIEELDSTVTSESDFLTPGDTLVVFFKYGNTHSQPRIKLYNGSVDSEIAISDDNGYKIQVVNLLDLNGIWADGESCRFIYDTNNNVSIWELLDSAVATEDTYGKVKITDDLSGETITDPTMTATASAIKALLDSQGGEYLQYQPAVTEDTLIGTLTLRSKDGSQLGNPALIYIPEFIDTDTFRIRTSELINDGPKKEQGENESEATIGYGHPYITRIIPGNLIFRKSYDENMLQKGLFYTYLEEVGEEQVEQEFLAYEITDNYNNSTLRSRGNLNLAVVDNNYIDLQGITKAEEEFTFNKKFYALLDVIVTTEQDAEETPTYSGEDADLYLGLVRLGWTDCIR